MIRPLAVSRLDHAQSFLNEIVVGPKSSSLAVDRHRRLLRVKPHAYGADADKKARRGEQARADPRASRSNRPYVIDALIG